LYAPGNVRAAANLKSTARDRRWLTERVTGLEKETCSDFSVRLGAHRTPQQPCGTESNQPVGLGWVGLGWCCFQGGLFVGWPKTPVSSGRCLFSFIDVVKGWRRDVRSAPAGAHRTGHERIQRERCMSASNVRADDDACRTDLLLIVFSSEENTLLIMYRNALNMPFLVLRFFYIVFSKHLPSYSRTSQFFVKN
jgi:hypothetical protein